MVLSPCMDGSQGVGLTPTPVTHRADGTCGAPVMSSTESRKDLNRLRVVREQQGITLRTISRRTGIPVRQLRCEEEPTNDLSLSILYRWQKALDVPLTELMIEPDGALSLLVGERAKMLRVMKTALSVCERARDEPTRRLGTMLCQQLRELMPELSEQTAWPTVGSRRSHDDMGRIAENPMRVDLTELY
jgi:transcriptional regulator with XRE-family HTH domain